MVASSTPSKRVSTAWKPPVRLRHQPIQSLVLGLKTPIPPVKALIHVGGQVGDTPILSVQSLIRMSLQIMETLIQRTRKEQLQNGDNGSRCSGNGANRTSFVPQPGRRAAPLSLT